ncbi:MAG: hypothetical protein J0I41_22325 [Filimonas sp.]|nr:hypothetical protein [Filimonas sp.]
MPHRIQVTSVLNKTRKRDSWFLDDYTINMYSGCSFNCLFCYIRGSKYGENMTAALSIKENAIDILHKQLAARAKKKQYGFIVVSSATEPYLHFEQEELLTQKALEVILHHRFPVHIITRSDLVARDFDLLAEIDNKAILPADLALTLQRGTIITFSFSTTDDTIAHVFEPGATLPSKRLQTLNATVQRGFLSGVSLMPLLPYISDTAAHLDEMFGSFKTAGAKYVLPATLTLFGSAPADSKQLVLRAIDKHYPHLSAKYRQFFGTSNEMPGYYRQAFHTKATALCKQYGISNQIIPPDAAT